MEAKKKQNEEQQTAELSGEELEQAAGGVAGANYTYKCKSCGWTGSASTAERAQKRHDAEHPDCTHQVSIYRRAGAGFMGPPYC